MTTYDFEGGSNGAAATTTLALCEIQAGTGNTVTFDATSPLEGGLSLKQVNGTSNVSLFQAWGTGVSGALGTTFGTPNTVGRGIIGIEVPVGGFSGTTVSENTGRNLTILGQMYGTSTGSGTVGRFRTPNKTTVSGATSATNVVTSTGHALINGDVLKPTAIGAATGITVGTNYYVIGKTTNTFQLSATPTGLAITLGTASGLAFNVEQALQYGNAAATSVTPIVNLTDYEGQWVWLRFEHDTGTTNANGVLHVKASNSAQSTIGVEMIATGLDMGSAAGTGYPITRVRWGVLSTQTSGRTVRWDYFGYTPGGAAVTGTASYLAFPGAVTAPTAVIVSTDQYPAAGATVTLNSTGSTVGSSGGSLTGYAWTCTEFPAGAAAPSITTPSASSTTVTLPAVGHYTFQLIVTQSGGGLSSSATAFTEYVHSGTGAPVGIYAVGTTTYTNEGGAANMVAALNDALTTTYALSQPITSTEDLPVTFLPCADGPIVITVSLQYFTASVNATVLVYKEDGVTLLYTASLGAVTATWASYDVTLDSTALTTLGSALSDRRMLKGIIRGS